MYNTDYLLSIEKLKKKFPDFSCSDGEFSFRFKSYNVPKFKWVEFLFYVSSNEDEKFGSLSTASYTSASRRVGGSLISDIFDHAYKLFYELTHDCRIEPLDSEGNIFALHSIGSYGVYSEKIRDDFYLDLFAKTTLGSDVIKSYFSNELGGFLHYSVKINEAIESFKERKRRLDFPNHHYFGLSTFNKFYLLNDGFYLFTPYDLDKHKQFNLFSYSENHLFVPFYNCHLTGTNMPLEHLTINEFFDTLSSSIANNHQANTKENIEFSLLLKNAIENKTIPFQFKNTVFYSKDIFSVATDSFSEGEFVFCSANLNNEFVGKILRYDEIRENYYVQILDKNMGTTWLGKKQLSKLGPFSPSSLNDILIFKSSSFNGYVFAEIKLQSSMGYIAYSEVQERYVFFTDEELSNKKKFLRLSSDESNLFKQFLNKKHEKSDFVLSIIGLRINSLKELSPVFHAILNAMLSFMSVESVVEQVIIAFKLDTPFFQKRFIQNNSNIFKKISLTQDSIES